MTAHLWIGFCVLAVLWAACVWLLARLEPPVEPAEFGAACECGHRFDAHNAEPHGTGSPCHFTDEEDRRCECGAFEPPGYDVRVFLDPEGERLAIVPLCRHPAYEVEQPGAGAPLQCIECGEELAE